MYVAKKIGLICAFCVSKIIKRRPMVLRMLTCDLVLENDLRLRSFFPRLENNIDREFSHSFQGDTSAMVLFVSCFGVDFCAV